MPQGLLFALPAATADIARLIAENGGFPVIQFPWSIPDRPRFLADNQIPC